VRILIADDQARRYERLIVGLEAIGVRRQDVDIVPSAKDARDCLDTHRYDLLILDILIPLWPEGEPSAQNALDLLFEIHEAEEQQGPRHIVGITADRSAARDAAREFEELTWTVVEYSAISDEWVSRILNCVRYISGILQSSAAVRPEYNIDLAIICALERPELEEVLKLPWSWSAARPLDDVTFIHDGKVEVQGRTITVCATAAPRMGMVSTALRSAAIIASLRPRLIAMCGICAGVKEKVSIGDVLFADPAWDFQSGKRVRDKSNTQFSIAPHHLSPPAIIRSHVEQIRSDSEALSKISLTFGTDAPGLTRVVIGPVASGSAVLADAQVVDEIKLQHRDLIGVEMEVYGMYAATYAASHPQPRPFALKGVCDFADPDKQDLHQRYAAYASAYVLRLLIERFGRRLLE
jgi:nucleoside phosphorylase